MNLKPALACFWTAARVHVVLYFNLISWWYVRFAGAAAKTFCSGCAQIVTFDRENVEIVTSGVGLHFSIILTLVSSLVTTCYKFSIDCLLICCSCDCHVQSAFHEFLCSFAVQCSAGLAIFPATLGIPIMHSQQQLHCLDVDSSYFHSLDILNIMLRY